MARFFIDRPIFAWVVAILIMLLGGLAITQLPIAQYPNVAPPSISVTANYAGASAETLQDTVTSVIEQQLNGIDNLLYMSSSSDASGLATVTLYFTPGTNPDTAQVQVQNKVQLATPSLPQTVQQQGVVIAKATRNFMMFFTLSTANDSLDQAALGNYIAANVLDPIRRVSGVGDALMFGSQYAMRVWLNPDQVEQLRPDRQRRDQRDPGPEHTGARWTDRRESFGRRPGIERDHARPDHLAHRAGVRGNRAADES